MLPGFSSAGDARSIVLAPYFVDQIALSDRLQLLAGARWDSIDFEDAVSGISRNQSELSPMLGLVFRVSETTSLYANAGRSFAPPSPRVVDAPEPEQSRQVEVGARWAAPDGRLRATIAAYELERDNIAIPDDNGFTQQAGDQRSRGVELELAARPARGWRALFNYAYNDAELTRFSELVQLPFPPGFAVFDRSGNQPGLRPRASGQLLGQPPLRPRLACRRRRPLGRRAVHRRGQRHPAGLLRAARRQLRSHPWRLAVEPPPREPDRPGVRDPRLRRRLGDPGAAVLGVAAARAAALKRPATERGEGPKDRA